MRDGYALPLVALGALVLGCAVAGARVTRAPNSYPPPGSVILQPPEGYRRARNAEVTAEQRAAASEALRRALGVLVHYPQFVIGVESHFDRARGWHKGASVFVPVGRA